MVTVIANQDELITPVHNGVHAGSNDNERTFIKDYQEVDFHRSNSCKPLPAIIDDKSEQSSIQGTYFVQIDACNSLNNDENSLLLILTDGISTVKGITIEAIPNLNLNVRPGCKLLLTGVIPIKNGLLQLSCENTRFQYGSNTYPRPKSAYRGRGGGGSYRVSNEGRRANGNSTNRYDNSTGETNFLKGPPPKTTLMDFMTKLKLTDDVKTTPDNHESSTTKDQRRRTHENSTTIDESNATSQTTTDSNEQIAFQQDEINDQVDSEDDPTHSNYRERRNPLPPRLQRAQEERTRRNTVRYYDELGYVPTNESSEPYHNGTTTNQSSSSSSSYSRHGDQTSYASTMNPYANLLTTVNGSFQPHLTYFPTNPSPFVYNLAGIPSPQFANPADPLAFCYGAPYATPYLPTSVSNMYNSESKGELSSNVQSSSSVDDNANESQQDEHQSQMSSSSSVNETNANSEQSETNKQRDSNSSNPRPRWKIGDLCLAKWSEDREFYPATIVQIHPPTCTVLFRDYNNYDQVHFSDLKVLPYYPYVTPPLVDSSASAYYPQRLPYYPSPIDGYIIMPEAPPFPFNSAGTLCMYVPPMTSVPRSNRYSNRQENGLANHQVNETTNDTSISNSSTVSNDAPSTTLVMHDDQQEENSQTNEDQSTHNKSSD